MVEGTKGKVSPYLIGGGLIAGAGLVYLLLSGPKVGFKDLVVSKYWSRVGDTELTGLSGGLLPIVNGSEFGGTIKFKHQGPGGNFTVGFYADIEGHECWAGPVAVEIEEDDEWVEYTIEVSGIMDTRGLPHCRRIGTRKEIRSEGGDVELDDDDDACYHVIGNGESNFIVVEEYWAEIGGVRIAGLPSSLIPIADGATFGARIRFTHRYLGGQFIVCSAIKVGDYWERAEAMVELPTTEDWNTYTVEVTSATPFSRHNLGHCKRLGTRNYILDETGDDLVGDDDADCYHIIERGESDFIVVEEYWAEISGVRFAAPPPVGLVPIADDSTWGCRVRFKHRYLGGQFKIACAIKVGDYREWAEKLVSLPTTRDWTTYTVELTSTNPCNRHSLNHCERPGTH